MPRFAALSVVLSALVAASAQAALVSYAFTGNCLDCAEAAGTERFDVSATLVLEDPVAGGPAGVDQFHSFRWDGSNLAAPFSVTRPDGGGDLVLDARDEDSSFYADFSTGLPGFAVVELAVVNGDAFAFFNTALDGGWTLFRTDVVVGDDFGDDGRWSAVPLPGTLALALLPLALLTLRPAGARARLR